MLTPTLPTKPTRCARCCWRLCKALARGGCWLVKRREEPFRLLTERCAGRAVVDDRVGHWRAEVGVDAHQVVRPVRELRGVSGRTPVAYVGVHGAGVAVDPDDVQGRSQLGAGGFQAV